MTDENYLRKVTLGTPEAGNIVLCPYDETWPLQYSEQADKIRKALGDKVRLLEHVGSTSVPGLCAKPILDILLLVDDTAREAEYVEPLEQAGYQLRVREEDWFGHRMFKGQNPVVNLHVFSLGCSEADRMLLFRDYLRTHLEDRDLYAETKERLSQTKWRFVQEYADRKTQVVHEIMDRAGICY